VKAEGLQPPELDLAPGGDSDLCGRIQQAKEAEDLQALPWPPRWAVGERRALAEP
jgi:hypothetical protein